MSDNGMNDGKTKRCGRKLIMVVLILLMSTIMIAGIGELATWDCPVCGRTGNTGNYCGACAYPAPWKRENMTNEDANNDDNQMGNEDVIFDNSTSTQSDPAAVQAEPGVPILIEAKSLAQQEDGEYSNYSKYSKKWFYDWDPNGSEGPWIIQCHYGGRDVNNRIEEEEIEKLNDPRSFETEYFPHAPEPGAIYSFRIISQGGAGPASEWHEVRVPEFTNYAELSIKKLVIPTAEFSRVISGEEYNWPCELLINNPTGYWVLAGQVPFVYAVSPDNNREKTRTSGGWYMWGDVDDFFNLAGSMWAWKDTFDEPGDYSIRFYVNGAKIGEGKFTMID